MLLQNRNQGQKSDSGFPARAALVRRLAGKKAVFGRFAGPFCKVIVTRHLRGVPNQIKNKKIGNPGINWHPQVTPVNSFVTLTLAKVTFFLHFFGGLEATQKRLTTGLACDEPRAILMLEKVPFRP